MNSKIDRIEIQSKALGQKMAITVYVPADFTDGLPVFISCMAAVVTKTSSMLSIFKLWPTR